MKILPILNYLDFYLNKSERDFSTGENTKYSLEKIGSS